MRKLVAVARSPGIVREFYQDSADRWILVIEKSSIYAWSESPIIEHSGKQFPRRPSTTPESSDIETIQNLIESSHLQFKSLQERLSPGPPSSEALATCQLNVRYLEDVKAGLAKGQNDRLSDKLAQMDDLIKSWRGLEVRLSQSYSLANGMHPRCKGSATGDPRESVSFGDDGDSAKSVRLRSKRFEPAENAGAQEENAAFRSHRAVIHEFEREHCRWQDITNELMNLEHVLTDCESLLRHLENDLSCSSLTEGDKANVYARVNEQLESLNCMDDVFQKVLELAEQIVPVLNISNQQWFEERLKRIKYRKQLLRYWCRDLLASSSPQDLTSAERFSCGACASEKATHDTDSPSCSTIQQRRLHYIRNFWRNTEEAAIDKCWEEVPTAATSKDRTPSTEESDKAVQCNIEQRVSGRSTRWRALLFTCIAMFFVLYIFSLAIRDCSRLYYNSWLNELLYPEHVPVC